MSDKTELRAQAARLMGDIRYQIFAPDVTTMGCCPSCPRVSRGNAKCPDCLTRELGYIVGTRAAREYLTACLAQREAEQRVYHAAEYGQ